MPLSRPTSHRALRRIPSALSDAFAPSFAALTLQPSRSFSASSSNAKRPDRNRGVSPLRRTGPAQKLSVHKYRLPVPKPISGKERAERIEVDPDHGLWQFFHDGKSPMVSPTYHSEHGRAWTAAELRQKGWEDLHALWWRCMKEQSKINTAVVERRRLQAGLGDVEAKERSKEVGRTRARIRQVLIERWYSWEDALKLAKEDETIDLSGEGPLYDSYRLRDEAGAEDEGNVQHLPTGAVGGKNLPSEGGKAPSVTL